MTETPLESFDLRQMKLWRKIIYDIYDRYREVF
jgi:hypothetical protein